MAVQVNPGRGDNRFLMGLGHYAAYIYPAGMAIAPVGAFPRLPVLLGWVASGVLIVGLAAYTADKAYSTALLVLGAFAVAGYVHRRLYPWCPFCHWGDGGSKESVPDVPDPAMSR